MSSLYEGWEISQWKSELSGRTSLSQVVLVDDGDLTITVEDLNSPEHERWEIRFYNAPAYRNILESFRLSLWTYLDDVVNLAPPRGPLLKVDRSSWITELQENEPTLSVFHPTLLHFILCTEDDVVEVLTPSEPTVRQVEPGDGRMTGKSLILQSPRDRVEIDKLMERFGNQTIPHQLPRDGSEESGVEGSA
jgi:hypothetical protein